MQSIVNFVHFAARNGEHYQNKIKKSFKKSHCCVHKNPSRNSWVRSNFGSATIHHFIDLKFRVPNVRKREFQTNRERTNLFVLRTKSEAVAW